MNLLEIKRYKDGKEVKEPLRENYRAFFPTVTDKQAEINFTIAQKQYNEATPYRVAVTCAEYIKLHKVKKEQGFGAFVENTLRSQYIDDYADFISQEPTNESCKGLVFVQDRKILSLEYIVSMYAEKTLEHFIMDGGTILIPVE